VRTVPLPVIWRQRRGTAWSRILRFVSRWQWLALAALWLLGLGLGIVGFEQWGTLHSQDYQTTDLVYRTVHLISFGSADVDPKVPWQLDVARFLVPAVSGVAAIRAVMVMLQDRTRQLSLSFTAGHTIVCGLGHKGSLLALSLLERGERVVAVERDASGEHVAACRVAGAIVLLGDARDARLLRRAGADRARALVAVCDDHGTNAEIAVAVSEIPRQRRVGPLTCFAHVVEPELCELLRLREAAYRYGGDDRGGLVLEFFNVYEQAAAKLLPLGSVAPTDGRPPRILIVGLGGLGRSLVLRIGTLRQLEGEPNPDRVQLLVLDRAANQKCGTLLATHPDLAHHCELVPLDTELPSASSVDLNLAFEPNGTCTVTEAFVCLDNDSLGLQTALALQQRLGAGLRRLVVRVSYRSGLAELFAQHRGEGIACFDLLEQTCTPELLEAGAHESLAQAIHERYRSYVAARDTLPHAAWHDLPTELRESNRQRAHRIGPQLRAVRYEAVALGSAITPVTFSPEEIETMARMEHEGWHEERAAEGFRLGPTKSLERHRHPAFVPWQQLPEHEREKNRAIVQAVPELLASLGLGLRHQQG
jgi:hypothetical protein